MDAYFWWPWVWGVSWKSPERMVVSGRTMVLDRKDGYKRAVPRVAVCSDFLYCRLSRIYGGRYTLAADFQRGKQTTIILPMTTIASAGVYFLSTLVELGPNNRVQATGNSLRSFFALAI